MGIISITQKIGGVRPKYGSLEDYLDTEILLSSGMFQASQPGCSFNSFFDESWKAFNIQIAQIKNAITDVTTTPVLPLISKATPATIEPINEPNA